MYALKEIDRPMLLPLLFPDRRQILGSVHLAGKVIEHESGYRAERARVVQLLPTLRQREDAVALALAYGADTGDLSEIVDLAKIDNLARAPLPPVRPIFVRVPPGSRPPARAPIDPAPLRIRPPDGGIG